MNQAKTERFIIFLVSLACMGLIIESLIAGWEFWVPPLVIVGTLFLWLMHIAGNPEYNVRKVAYFGYAALVVFFYGVHENSIFDVGIVIAFTMFIYSFFNHPYMMNTLLGEFLALILIQFLIAYNGSGINFSVLDLYRIVLHVLIVVLSYFCCMKAIEDRSEMLYSNKEKDDLIETVDSDMEDFLTNISHELRTPVNVVNGMSEMIIKKDSAKEAFAIKNAGIRLAYQIEDIQDYTECKREKVILEEDDYMSTSLINDVVTGFRFLNNEKNLEMIVDMDPMVPTKMRGDVKKIHKIFRHLLENGIKFARKGGIYVKLFSESTDYGVNLCIEMTDTGIGMDRWTIAAAPKGMFQVDKKRNRSAGGIGLGLFVVYGFAHRMGGFVRIESEKHAGTTVRVTIPQKVVDKTPCLSLSKNFGGVIIFHVRSDKYKVPKVRDFYRDMAANLANGIHVQLYPAETVREIDRLMEKLDVSVIFMGQEEYEENPEYFEELSKKDVVVAVSAAPDFKLNSNSGVILMPKPLYAYPVIRVLNEGKNAGDLTHLGQKARPSFNNVKALVVDDEPMNLVVATELFKEYDMLTETAGSGREAINKYRNGDYDVVFMDHMMPGMDGVEAMKQIKDIAAQDHRNVIMIALTANVVSGAREMFMKEGFDGFIAKPINIADFERVMIRELPKSVEDKGGQSL